MIRNTPPQVKKPEIIRREVASLNTNKIADWLIFPWRHKLFPYNNNSKSCYRQKEVDYSYSIIVRQSLQSAMSVNHPIKPLNMIYDILIYQLPLYVISIQHKWI